MSKKKKEHESRRIVDLGGRDHSGSEATKPDVDGSASGNSELPGDVYTQWMAYYFHQDNLSWSRTQLLFGIEAATLAAAFTLPALAIVTLLFGTVLILLVRHLILRDNEIRDDHIVQVLDKTHIPRGLRMTTTSQTRLLGKPAQGGYILDLMMAIVVAANLTLLAGFVIVPVAHELFDIMGGSSYDCFRG